jgi:hypothetical protein
VYNNEIPALYLIWSLYDAFMLFCVDSLNDNLALMNSISKVMIDPLYVVNAVLSQRFSCNIWAYADKLLSVSHRKSLICIKSRMINIQNCKNRNQSSSLTTLMQNISCLAYHTSKHSLPHSLQIYTGYIIYLHINYPLFIWLHIREIRIDS